MISAIYLNQRQAFKSYLWFQEPVNGGIYAKFQTFDEFMKRLRKGDYTCYGIKVIFRP